VPDAIEVGSEMDLCVQEYETYPEQRTQIAAKLIKLLQDIFNDLARIPFIRENQVFQQFFELERLPFTRTNVSMVLPDFSPVIKSNQKPPLASSNYKIPDRLTRLEEVMDEDETVLNDFSPLKDDVMHSKLRYPTGR
jgi:hypothetical protein